MHSYVLQDWVTIRGASGVKSVPQNERTWLDLAGYQDVIMWLQVAEVTTGSGTIVVSYDTAPIKDETLFVAMGSTTVSSAAMSPTLTKVLLSQLPNQPLCRWVRWRLTQTLASATWDITFRILVAANCVSANYRTAAT
jgi:hypothetical protein